MKSFILLILFVLPTSLLGQLNYILSGEIKDAISGEPLVAATVQACDLICSTDLNGKFNLEVAESTCLMEVRYLGYESFLETIELPLEDGKEFIIFLTPSTNILDQAVITANKFKQRQSESTVSLAVVKSELISTSNKPSADEVLDLVPGVDIIDGQANIRGGSGFSYGAGSRVLLVIDEMPALQYDGGNARWDDIPVENISSVEVLKGASSVLYGSSALNGVIQFTSQKPGMIPKTNVGVSYRHFLPPEDERRQWWDSAPIETSAFIAHNQKFKKLDLSASGFFNRLESFNESTNETRGRANIRLKYKYNNRLHISLNTNINAGNNSSFFYWGNALRKSFQPGDNTVVQNRVTRIMIDPVVEYYADNSTKHTFKSRYYSSDNVNDNDQTVKSDFQYLSYNFRKSFDPIQAKLIVGLEGLANQTTAELYSNAYYTGYNAAAFIQWNQKLWNSLNYVIGGRYEFNQLNNPDFDYEVDDELFFVEKNNATESKPVFRTGLNYEPLKGSYIRASIGQGYRYPTIAEKFTTAVAGGIKVVPNPSLESETGWSGEIGYRQEFKVNFLSMYIDVAGFYSRYNNMMEFTLSDKFLGGFEARNIGNTIIQGFDNSLGMQWEIGALTIRNLFSYTYMDPKYTDFTESIKASATSDENILKYRYRHSFKSNLQIELWGFSLWINQRYNSHMVSIDRNFEQFINGIADFRNNFGSGYNIWSSQLSYAYKNVRLGINFDNMTNVLYTERPALLEAPRNISIRLEYTFIKDKSRK